MHKLQYIKSLIMYNLYIEISGRTADNNAYSYIANCYEKYNETIQYVCIIIFITNKNEEIYGIAVFSVFFFPPV